MHTMCKPCQVCGLNKNANDEILPVQQKNGTENKQIILNKSFTGNLPFIPK